MDFEAYPSWNPFIVYIIGIPGLGEHLQVKMQPPGSARMTFHPKITVFEPRKKFQWLGHVIIPGIFDGKHTFHLEEQPDGMTLFRQYETFSGVLVPIFRKMLHNTKSGFEMMNAALKEKAEENS
jgi:hypothetical protein